MYYFDGIEGIFRDSMLEWPIVSRQRLEIFVDHIISDFFQSLVGPIVEFMITFVELCFNSI